MKEQHQGIQLYSNLLNEISDIKSELIKPNDFAERSNKTYKVLLEELEAYLFENDVYHLHRYQELKSKLDLLLECVSDRIRILTLN